jgi:hypothetical protein
VKVLAVHRRAGLAHLRRQHHAHGLGIRAHGQRDAQIANDRGHNVAVPVPVVLVAAAAPQPDAGRVDCLLSERSESLSLKRRVSVAHLTAAKERLQPVVGRPGQQHAAQDLPTLVGRQRGPKRGAPHEGVTRVHDLVDGQGQACGRADARCGFPETLQLAGRQPFPKLLGKRRTNRVDTGFAPRAGAARRPRTPPGRARPQTETVRDELGEPVDHAGSGGNPVDHGC